MPTSLDHFLSLEIRHQIEKRYYAHVNEQSRFELLLHDPTFFDSREKHVGVFSDHGVVHVRDVTQKLLKVLDTVHGVLIPIRSSPRLALMRGYGVLVAYLHDIGMRDFSAFGRAMHPEFAAQGPFCPELADVIQAMWSENSGNIAWHLLNLWNEGVLTQEPQLVLREMLSLSMAHSKSKVSVIALNDPRILRDCVLAAIITDLRVLHARLSGEEAVDQENEWLRPYYQNPHKEAFQWLISPHPALQTLTQDVIDTLRVLRCADALRQRGTVLATSGGYEIFVNQHTGNAVVALRRTDANLYLLEFNDPISAGEAIIASSELDVVGDLRISFARGAFSGPAATERAVYSTAVVVHDIQQDVIESFQRPDTDGLKSHSQMKILLEEAEDNPDFAELVQLQLCALDFSVGQRVQIVPSLQLASDLERERYRAGDVCDWARLLRLDFLARLSQSGHAAHVINPDVAFQGVRLVTVHGGEVLMHANTPAAFVYVPFGPGLKVIPLSGSSAFTLRPWMPLGVTGVIRGAVRNAKVIAEQTVQMLMIPRAVYLKYWHHTHSWESLQKVVKQPTTDKTELLLIEKIALLQMVPLLAGLSQKMLRPLADAAVMVSCAAEEVVFAQGEWGSSLYLIVRGSVRVERDGRLLARLGAGEIFGEMAILTSEPRMASVLAEQPTQLLRLDHQALDKLFEMHPSLARGIIEVLSQRLRQSGQATAIEE